MGTARLSSAVKDQWARREYLLGVSVCLAVVAFGLPTLHYPFRRDHGEFAATAQVILDGGVPYRDVWNPKPPAILALYAAIIHVAGPNMMAIRVVDLASAAATAVLLARMGRRLWGRSGGLVAGVAYGALYFSHRAEDLAQNDGFMTVVMVISAACLWPAPEHGRWGRALLAGLAAGLAVAFKYPTGLWALYLLAWLLFDRRQPARERLAEGGLYAAGALLVWVPLVVYLTTQGALYAFWESILTTSGYTQVGMDKALGLVLLTAFGYFFVGHQFGPSVLALGSLAASPPGTEPRRLYRFTWGWLLVATASIFVQVKFYDYHWLPVLPPLALLVGGGFLAFRCLLSSLFRRLGAAQGHKKATMVAGVLVLGYLVFRVVSYPWLIGYGWHCLAADERDYLARFGGEQDNYVTNLEVAHYVAMRSKPDDRLFIWGFEPVIYVLSDRRPATRFIYSYPLVGAWYPAYWRGQAMDQLYASNPAFILVLENDALPTVTGRETDSLTQLQDLPELSQLIEQNYALAEQIGNCRIYQEMDDEG